MVLAEAEMLARIDDFLSLKPKIEHHTQMARVGDHDRQVFAGYVRREAQQEAVRIGGCEADANVLGDRGAPRSQEIVFDGRARSQIDADFCANSDRKVSGELFDFVLTHRQERSSQAN